MSTKIKMRKKKKYNQKELTWKIIESYFKGKHLERLVRHQIESYNHFIHHQIQNTIDMFNPVKIVGDYNETLNKHELEINIVFSNFLNKKILILIIIFISFCRM